MDGKNPKEAQAAGEPDRLSTEDQVQKDSLSQLEEERIPWAEIISEPEQGPYATSEENPTTREGHRVNISFGYGFFSRIYNMLAESNPHGPMEGPPLAVLALILLAFILWMST